jgi:hypothetical protein
MFLLIEKSNETIGKGHDLYDDICEGAQKLLENSPKSLVFSPQFEYNYNTNRFAFECKYDETVVFKYVYEEEGVEGSNGVYVSMDLYKLSYESIEDIRKLSTYLNNNIAKNIKDRLLKRQI